MKSSPSAGSKRVKTILPLLPRGFAPAATATIAAIAAARKPNAISLHMFPPFLFVSGCRPDARTERSRKAPSQQTRRAQDPGFWRVFGADARRLSSANEADRAPNTQRPRHGC